MSGGAVTFCEPGVPCDQCQYQMACYSEETVPWMGGGKSHRRRRRKPLAASTIRDKQRATDSPTSGSLALLSDEEG